MAIQCVGKQQNCQSRSCRKVRPLRKNSFVYNINWTISSASLVNLFLIFEAIHRSLVYGPVGPSKLHPPSLHHSRRPDTLTNQIRGRFSQTIGSKYTSNQYAHTAVLTKWRRCKTCAQKTSSWLSSEHLWEFNTLAYATRPPLSHGRCRNVTCSLLRVMPFR